MTRIGLAVLMLLLAGTHAHAGGISQCVPACDPCQLCLAGSCVGLSCGGGCSPACDQCQICLASTCLAVAGIPCNAGNGVCQSEGCVAFTPTATPTSTPTNTSTPSSTPTPTATPTPTPHNLSNGQVCNDSRQCGSTLCNGGVCAEMNPAPAVSNHTAVLMGAALLLLGLWSVGRVARRR